MLAHAPSTPRPPRRRPPGAERRRPSQSAQVSRRRRRLRATSSRTASSSSTATRSARIARTARRASRERAGHRPDALHGDSRDDRRAHPHDVLLGFDVGHGSVAAAAAHARADDRARARQLRRHARDRRDDRARSRLVELHRHRDARFDQQGGLDRTANVRRRLRACSARVLPIRADTDTTHTLRGRVYQHLSNPRSGEAAGRRRRRLHQDVRLDRQRRRRHRQRDVQRSTR